MAEYGRLYKKFWNSRRSTPDEAKLLFCYLIANEHANIVGLYRLPLAYVAEDLDWTIPKIERAMEALGHLVEYDKVSRVIFIPSWFSFNPLASSNHIKRANAELEELPDTYLYQQFYENLEAFGGLHIDLRNAVRTPSKGRSNSGTGTGTIAGSKTSSAPTGETGSPPEQSGIEFDFEQGSFSGIGEPDLAIWREAYPAIDVETEIKKAAAWLKANPKNRKKNYERFIVNWLARAQEKAPPIRKAGENGSSRNGSRIPAPAGKYND